MLLYYPRVLIIEERGAPAVKGTWTSDIYEIVIVKSESCTKQATTSPLGEDKKIIVLFIYFSVVD